VSSLIISHLTYPIQIIILSDTSSIHSINISYSHQHTQLSTLALRDDIVMNSE